MNLAAIDLNLLVSLDALLAHGSVGAAARAVGLSQPAMSHALARLRSQLGDPLLVRSAGVTRLTPRAESIRAEVRSAVESVARVLAPERFDPTVSTRRFRVMLSDYVSALIIPDLLRYLSDAAPGVTVEVVPWDRDATRCRAAITDVDGALACTPHEYPTLRRRSLFCDRDALIVGPEADLLPGADASTVLAAPHVAVVEHDHDVDPVDAWLSSIGLRRRVVASVPQYLVALRLVGEGKLAAIVPERLARKYERALRLDVRPVPLDVGTFDEVLLHDEAKHHDPGSVWLREALVSVARALPSFIDPGAGGGASRARPGRSA